MAKNQYQVVVIGGGAAGVAAARRLHEAGVETLIVEARDRLGGRAWTIADAAGVALDLGCGWLHSADVNPWREIAERRGLAIDRTPPPWSRPQAHAGIGKADQTAFYKALTSFRERTDLEGQAGPDRPASTLLEPRSRWTALLDAISTFYSGVELDRVSIVDLARYQDTGVNWRLRSGYGALIADYGAGLPAQLGCAVRRIDRRGARPRVETDQGTLVADAVVVTLPSNVLAAAPDFFLPALPAKTEAAANLPLGLADKLFISLADPEQFEKDSRCWGNTDRTATAAYHLRPFGRPMIEAYFGGSNAAELEKGGERAFFDFASAELAALFGDTFRRRIKPLAHHSWRADPFARGSYSYALPGKADCRATLAAPLEGRLFFAGEACSREDFSTAHGAYRTGVAAADQAIAALKGAKPGARAGI
jgi:monoamine oxidase